MNWTSLLALGLYVLACARVVHLAATEGWSARRAAGPVAFLIGAGVGTFLDDLLPAESQLQPWIEPVAVALVLVGAVAWWRAEEREAGSSRSSP